MRRFLGRRWHETVAAVARRRNAGLQLSDQTRDIESSTNDRSAARSTRLPSVGYGVTLARSHSATFSVSDTEAVNLLATAWRLTSKEGCGLRACRTATMSSGRKLDDRNRMFVFASLPSTPRNMSCHLNHSRLCQHIRK